LVDSLLYFSHSARGLRRTPVLPIQKSSGFLSNTRCHAVRRSCTVAPTGTLVPCASTMAVSASW
jgi:hypothetical protein